VLKSEVTRQEEEAKSPSPELGYVENDPVTTNDGIDPVTPLLIVILVEFHVLDHLRSCHNNHIC